MKRISILGATGSVGRQALDVAASRGYKVDFLSARRDTLAMEAACRRFNPACVAMSDEAAARELKTSLSDTNIKVLSGEEGIIEGIRASESEVVVNSIIGEAGLMPTLAVIDSG